MSEVEKNVNADPSGDQRISPATLQVEEASAKASRSTCFGLSKIAVTLISCLVVAAVGAGVTFGVGGLFFSEPGKSAENTQAEQPAANQASPGNENATDSASPSNEAAPSSEGDASPSESEASAASIPSSGEPSSSASSGGSQSEPSAEPVPAVPATITVSVYVDSSRAPGYPACMASTTVTLSEGASVYDALCASGVSVGGSSSYVRSINGLAEKLPGYEAGSGWMYSVNGSFPSVSCGRYKLSGGESIYWAYTLNMGKDL